MRHQQKSNPIILEKSKNIFTEINQNMWDKKQINQNKHHIIRFVNLRMEPHKCLRREATKPGNGTLKIVYEVREAPLQKQ